MRNSCLLLVALMCLATVPVQAKEEALRDSGNAFVRMCSSIDKPFEQVTGVEQIHNIACAAYLAGLLDGIDVEITILITDSKTKVAEPYCSRDTRGLEERQSVDILLKFIRDNPAKAHLPTPVLFAVAMQEAFPPCPDKK